MSREGTVVGPDQRITPMDALKPRTLFAAEQYDGEQASRGSLEMGQLADLVVLEKNHLTVDSMAIRDIRVVETIKEGRTIYQGQ